MKQIFVLLLVIVNACVAFSQKEKQAKHTQTMHFIFQNTVGDSLLQTGVTYTNAFGEPFTIRAFKYYVSGIQLQYADSSSYKVNTAPHLINEADSSSKQLHFTAPEGTVTGIQFLLGVDSLVNTTGVQAGDLDPAKGMYWVWNTGYIMAKLEGFSPAAKSPAHQFTYDIGGYKQGENATRTITLSVPFVNHQQMSLSQNNFIIKADALKWFTGVNDIQIAAQPMCHEPGTLAMQIADNYQQMFSVKKDHD